MLGGDKSREYGGCSKAITLCLAMYFSNHQWPMRLLKFMDTSSMDCHWRSHGHHKNVYGTLKPTLFFPLSPYHTIGCCILLRIYPTGSLWCRQSQQSFNTSTPPFFIFPSYSLHVSAPTGHPQVRYTIRCFQGLFLLQRIRCMYTTWRMPILVLWPNHTLLPAFIMSLKEIRRLAKHKMLYSQVVCSVDYFQLQQINNP
jgi:hypothetical protein